MEHFGGSFVLRHYQYLCLYVKNMMRLLRFFMCFWPLMVGYGLMIFNTALAQSYYLSNGCYLKKG